jgi:hypothetical protein
MPIWSDGLQNHDVRVPGDEFRIDEPQVNVSAVLQADY